MGRDVNQKVWLTDLITILALNNGLLYTWTDCSSMPLFLEAEPQTLGSLNVDFYKACYSVMSELCHKEFHRIR